MVKIWQRRFVKPEVIQKLVEKFDLLGQVSDMKKPVHVAEEQLRILLL